MKKILISCAVIFTYSLSAQVGVDTSDPQQKLHISGESTITNGVVGPTIRVDGLNEANNAPVSSDIGIKPVYANPYGDLILMNDSISSGYGYLYGGNTAADDIPFIISDSINLGNNSQIAVYEGGQASTTVIKFIEFTLPTKSLVHFNKSVSLNFVTNEDTPNVISDDIPRFADVSFRVVESPGNVMNNKYIALDGTSYTSASSSSSTGFVFVTGSESVIMPAGHYKIRLLGRAFGNPSIEDGTQSFICTFGEADQDNVSIIAEPWLY